MTVELTKDVFAPLLHTNFRLPYGAGQALTLELIDVSGDDHATALTKGHEYFALLFRGPLELFVPQATYQLEHEQTGPFDIFLVPVEQGAAGYEYQAIFNRAL